MSDKFHKLSIIAILILALFLRGYKIDSYPPINPDEAALGYNAYSLLLTGKDEHGASWPIHFQSFGDFKPGGYIYLILPWIKIIGLNVLAVRLPNLIFSVVGIYCLYLIVKHLSKRPSLALLTALVICLNPWHIHFSRGGWEASTALAFILLGSYFFLHYIATKKYHNFLLFILFFVASLYTYHSARIIAPLLGLTYFFTYRQVLLKSKKMILFGLLIGALIALPVVVSFVNNGGSARFNGVGLTADQGPFWRSNELLSQHQPVTIVSRVIHNQRILYLFSWIDKYTSHFDLNFLFTTGDSVPRSKIPRMGQFYLFEVIFFLIGIYIYLHKSYFPTHRSLLFFWLLIAPIASSLTFQAPSALRALPLTIPISLCIACCLYFIINNHRRLSVIILIMYLFGLINYLKSYYYDYFQEYPQAWSYGFDQIIPYVNTQKSLYNTIYFTNKYDQPYILYLFFSQYNPQSAQKQTLLTPPDQYGFSTVRQIDNIIFQKTQNGIYPPKSLIIASDEKLNFNLKRVINFPNGQPEFKIYSND